MSQRPAKQQRVVYAGFWRRVRANVVDLIVLMPVAILKFWCVSSSRTAIFLIAFPLSFVYALYNICCHASWGQTLGKLANSIRVVGVSGQRISWKTAVLRSGVDAAFAVLSVTALAVGLLRAPGAEATFPGSLAGVAVFAAHVPAWSIGMAWASRLWIGSEMVVILFNTKRRALQDYIAGTVVVHTDARGRRAAVK